MGRPELVKRYVELKQGIQNRRAEAERKNQQFRKDYAPILNDLNKLTRGVGKGIKTGLDKYGGPALTNRASSRSRNRMGFFD